MAFEIKSMVTGRKYCPNESVRIVNLNQADKYIKHGATVYDIYISRDKVVFIFNKEETRELYDLWCKYELE